ncbi:MAG: hypothetical protein HQK56_04125 [Deltaproteobacteria bacterium]|nr:hypothetical protein [Deltaproteobacteria bacterium]
MKKEIGVTSEIDGYCTKCKLVTNHRVVAMDEGVVKRVVCLTCGGQHNFHLPPGLKSTTEKKVKRVKKEERRVPGPESQTLLQWQELKDRLTPETPAGPYSMSGSFALGEAIEHAKFGLGFVTKVIDSKKIMVMFEKEIKTMVMNFPDVAGLPTPPPTPSSEVEYSATSPA